MILEQFKSRTTTIIDETVLKTYIQFCTDNHEPKLKDGENHHILPRALFKDFENFDIYPENKTRLSYSNHLKAHYLLTLSIESEELLYSFNMMNNFYNKNNIANLENYDKLKKQFKQLLKTSKWCKSSKGKRWMFKDGSYDFVEKDNIENYLKNGWVFQGNAKQRIWINNGTITKRVFKDSIELKTWNIGRLETKSKNKTIWMNNGNRSTRIDKTKVNEFLKIGWKKGQINESTKGYIRISKNNKNTTIKKEDMEKYLKDGWKLGAYKVICSDCLTEVSSIGKQNHKCKGKDYEYTFNFKRV